MAQTKLKGVIVGYGSIGRRHAQNLFSLGVREIFFLRHKKRGVLPAHHFVDIQSVLDRKPDFAIIANPTSAHIPLALAFAKAGMNLFVEKPLSHTMRGVRELMAAARAKKLVTMVGYNFRFHPQLQYIKKILDGNGIGKVVSGRASAGQYLPDWHPEEDYARGYAARRALGGGVILTLIHEIDYLSWLLGEPQRVFCMDGKLSGLALDTEDVADILIKYRGGAHGAVHLDYVQRAPRRTLEIIGTEGTILWDYDAGTLRLYRAKEKKWRTHTLPRAFTRNTMFLLEMKHFLDCVRHGRQTEIPFAEGARSLATALAAKKSSVREKLIKL